MPQPDDYFDQQKRMVRDLEQSFLSNQRRSTVVEMQKDYADDRQTCLTSVVFIPDDIAGLITERVSEPLRKIDPSQYFHTEDSLHLTIKNVRTIHDPPLFDAADVDKVDRLFQELIPRFAEFEFTVEDVLLFPTSISVMAYTNKEFRELVLALDEGLKRVGVPDNKKYLSDSVFWGNITVCRFTQNPSDELVAAVKKLRNIKLGKFKVRRIDLITCNAVCHPASRKVINAYELQSQLD